MRRWVAVLGIVGVFLAPVVPAESAAPMCQGEEATIVGGPGELIQGTDGADVIVTNGATLTRAGAGDDLVCTTQMKGRAAQVFAEDGDDSVVARTPYERLEVNLGAGSDRFVGGAGRDSVNTTDPLDATDRDDVVFTGAGHDRVQATRPLGPATHDADQIDLGSGDDVLGLGDSGLAPTAVVVGGAGNDLLVVNSDNEGTDVTIDTEAGTIERGGPYLQDWVSFESYFVKEFGAHVSFQGSSANEHLEVASSGYDARMAGGNDVVVTMSSDVAELTGGAGRDRLIVDHFSSAGRPWIDLQRGVYGYVQDGFQVSAHVAGFEDARASGGERPLVVGDGRANHLVSNCGTVRGNGGADRIKELAPRYIRPPRPDACTVSRFVALGGPGPDVLVGSAGPDRLLGGPGRDRAIGRAGRDRCVAENQRQCEA